MRQKILIAVGNKGYTDILREVFSKYPDDFSLSSNEVFHRRFLKEIVDTEKPDILVIHDHYLESEETVQEKKDQELLKILRELLITYEDSLRVIFLCERPRGDLLLSALVSIGIKDIFNTRTFDIGVFIEQIKDKPRFSRVEKFLVVPGESSSSIPSEQEEMEQEEMEETAEETDEDESESTKPTKEKPVRPIVQKVIEKKVIEKKVEKKVVQKVVNKNVIKRDYQIQIMNQTEKIVGIPVKKKLVMVISPLSRSGSTFVSHLLVRALTQSNTTAAYVESPFSWAYSYDRLNGTQFADDYRSKFYQFSKFIDPKFESVFDWEKEQVQLICKHPTKEPLYKEEDVSFEHLIRVLYSLQSTITVLDVGADWRYEIFQDMFDLADHVYIVLEPDISFIQRLEEVLTDNVILQKLMEDERTSIIGNRFHEQITQNKLIQDLYKGKLKTIFPVFPVQDVYQAQYQGIFLNDYKDYQKRAESYLQPLLEDILPKEFLKKQKKKGKLLGSLFGSKISVTKTETKGEQPTT